MPKLSDFKPDDKWTILGVGTNGSGKTIALSSWAKLGPLWIADFDGRVKPLIEFYKRTLPNPEILNNIRYDTYGPKNYLDFTKKFEALQDDPYSFEREFGDPYPVTTLLDSLTSLSVTIITYSMLVAGAEVKLSRAKQSKSLPIPDWPEFNAEATQFAQILDIGKVMKSHFICTAHPITRTKVEKSGSTLTGRTYTSLVSAGVKAVDLIPNYFNEIWMFDYETSYDENGQQLKRIINTQPAVKGDIAKTAIGLPPTFDFTNSLLYEKVSEFIKQRDLKESVVSENIS